MQTIEPRTQTHRSSCTSGHIPIPEHDLGKKPSMSNLPEEILVEILHRLPVKCIGQCRCVSRRWSALLSQPQFIKTHLHRSINLQRESLVLTSESDESVYYALWDSAHHLFDEITISPTRLSFPGYADSFTQVYGSCNGLLLVEDNEGNKFVLNPITGEIKDVPPVPFADENPGSLHGFGYDSASDDYKIVTFSPCDADIMYNPLKRTKVVVYVCSVKKGTWKKAERSPYYHGDAYLQVAVFVDGYIHWKARRTTNSKYAIVAFDLSEEKFHEVPLPSFIEGDKFARYDLGVLGGCLCMHRNETVWVMKEYGVQESWTKFTLNNPEGADLLPRCSLGQEQVVMLMEEGLADKFVLYNLKHGTLKDVVIDGDSDDFSIAMSFVESLVSPPLGSNEKG